MQKLLFEPSISLIIFFLISTVIVTEFGTNQRTLWEKWNQKIQKKKKNFKNTEEYRFEGNKEDVRMKHDAGHETIACRCVSDSKNKRPFFSLYSTLFVLQST